jgi:DNA-binding transcriptional LysR family regulator
MGAKVYNHRLDHFIAACEEGSFSGASRRLYVTPSAVIQQVNLLEADLGVQLLQRGHGGVAPTQAGEYLYGAAKSYVARGNEMRGRVAEIAGAARTRITVGTSPFHRVSRLYELWFRHEQALKEAGAAVPEIAIEEIEVSRELPGIDMLEGPLFEVPWQGGFEFKKLEESPLCVSVSVRHPLSGRRVAGVGEFACAPVMAIREGMEDAADAACAELAAAGVELVRVGIYDAAAIGRCITEGMGLLVPACWHDISPQISCVELDWPHAVAYGIHLSKSAGEAARAFARSVL